MLDSSKSYKIIEIKKEYNRLNKKKHRATIASIGSTFILGMVCATIIGVTCFEPLNTIEKEMRELLTMIFAVIGAGDLYFLFNSICRKVGLEVLI